MPRRKTTPAPASTKEAPEKKTRASRKKDQDATSSIKLTEVAKAQSASKAKHLKAANTNNKYASNISAARKWLVGHFTTEGGAQDSAGNVLSEATQPGCTAATADAEPTDAYLDPDYQHAFEAIPNRLSPGALALYLTYKCLIQNNKIGTADSIRAAFKHMWEQANDSVYRGKWAQNPITKEWEGNPVNSAAVEDVMKTIKHKSHAEEGDRTHSVAMSFQHMQKMYEWSKAQLDTSSQPGTLEDRLLKIKHLEFRAFASLAWMTFARCFEMTKVKYKDIKLYLVNEAAFGLHYHQIHLRDRKGWQRKLGQTDREGELKSNIFKIYDYPKMEGCNAFSLLVEWVTYLEELYGRKLQGEDYIFPAVGANGIVQPGNAISHDTVQKWVNEFTCGSGIARECAGNFTTHCFRRGGAQYFFMFAPLGMRWNLRAIRWWGGWAEGEHRNTLIRYLLDELWTYQEDFSDAMCPIKQGTDSGDLGEGFIAAPATNESLMMMHGQITKEIQDLKANIKTDLAKEILTSLQDITITRNAQMSHRAAASQPGTLPDSSFESAPDTLQLASSTRPASPSTPGSESTPLPLAPIPELFPRGLVIPKIPVWFSPTVRADPKDSWRWIVTHWNEGDPERGLAIPLKDWDIKWLRGPNKKIFGAKHHQRAVIATEFLHQYRENEAEFLAAYPEAESGHSALLDAIHRARIARGDAKPRRRKNQATVEI